MTDLPARSERLPATYAREQKVVRSTPIPIGTPHPDLRVEKFLTMLFGPPEIRALKNTLARIADGQDQRTPYPTLFKLNPGPDETIDELSMEAELVQYATPPPFI